MLTRTGESEVRRWFAEDLRVLSPVVHNPAIIDAFAKVPREEYLGSGPWRIHSRLQVGAVHTSPSATLHEIYHDVLVSLDEKRGLNSGPPSLWAFVFDHLNITPGRCDLVKIKIGSLVVGPEIRTRAIVVLQKTGRPVQFELMADARSSLLSWLERRGGTIDDYAFPSRIDRSAHMGTRQYARLVDEWVGAIGLRPEDYGTHSLRRTKASIIYKATGNLRAVPAWPHQNRKHRPIPRRGHRRCVDPRRGN